MSGLHLHGKSPERTLRVLVALFLITAGFGQKAGIPPLLLDGLSADKFAEREKTQARLVDWARKHPSPDAADRLLLAQMQEAEDPEIRSRCREALKAFVLEREYQADGFLGVRMEELLVQLPGGAGEGKALRVTGVVDDSAASHAGITEGTLIIGLGARTWKDGQMALEFTDQIRRTRPGTTVTLQLLVEAAVVKKELKIGERPTLAANVDGADPAKANELAREKFFQGWLDKRAKRPR